MCFLCCDVMHTECFCDVFYRNKPSRCVIYCVMVSYTQTLVFVQWCKSPLMFYRHKPSFLSKGPSHRATVNGQGNEGIAECTCVCYLNSAAMMWTEDEGFVCPIQHVYLLFGLSVRFSSLWKLLF